MSANQRGDDRRDATSDALFALEPQQITIGREIGKGAFSVVFAGEFAKKRVAVKCQPKDAFGAIPPYVLKEVQILQKLQHPRLLEFIGACDNRKAKQVWILSELADNCDVAILLQSMRRGSIAHVGWRRLVLIALDAAQGIAFLHSQRVIHRDIKSSNILLDTEYRAKLCDFGFAMDMAPETASAATTATSTAEEPALTEVRRKSYCGTDAYMAPEMFLDEDYDASVDIFSFGVVLLELLCCRTASHDDFLARLPQHKFRVDVAEFRDALPASCPPAFARLSEQCVAFEPRERPLADAVVAALEALLGQRDVLDAADALPVELRPFTPLAKLDVAECEPQMDDDDEEEEEDNDDHSDDDDDEDASDDGCGKGDDTIDLEADEADHSREFASEAVDQPFGDEVAGAGASASAAATSASPASADSTLDVCASKCLPTPRPPRHAGVLLKRNRRGARGWTAKWFELDGDELHYSDVVAPSASASEELPIASTASALQQRRTSAAAAASRRSSAAAAPPPPQISTLTLRDCRIWKTLEMPELCFHVIDGNWKIKRELQATSCVDLELWMARLEQAIEFANDCVAPAASAAATSTGKHHRKAKAKSRATSTAATTTALPASSASIDMRLCGSKAPASPPRSGKQFEMRCPESAKQQDENETDDAHATTPETESETSGDEIFAWLEPLGLQRYVSVFRAKGFGTIDFIRETGIEKEDLNFLGIKDAGARKALTAAARELRGADD